MPKYRRALWCVPHGSYLKPPSHFDAAWQGFITCSAGQMSWHELLLNLQFSRWDFFLQRFWQFAATKKLLEALSTWPALIKKWHLWWYSRLRPPSVKLLGSLHSRKYHNYRPETVYHMEPVWKRRESAWQIHQTPQRPHTLRQKQASNPRGSDAAERKPTRDGSPYCSRLPVCMFRERKKELASSSLFICQIKDTVSPPLPKKVLSHWNPKSALHPEKKSLNDLIIPQSALLGLLNGVLMKSGLK